jgi:hypothetical protein
METLLGDLGEDNRPLVELMRQRTLKLTGKKPKLEWLGMSWNWCETTKFDEKSKLMAVQLIPDPSNPRVALTISTSFFESHPPSKLPKQLHQGLSNATCIGQTSWCECSLSSAESIEAIETVIGLALS